MSDTGERSDGPDEEATGADEGKQASDESTDGAEAGETPSGPQLLDLDEALGDSDVELILDEDEEPAPTPPPEPAASPQSRPNMDALRVIGAQLQAAERERDEARSELEKAKAELEEAKQSVVRSAADLDNFRKRVRRERGEDKKQAAASVVKDLLPVTDNFERARAQAEEAAAAGEVPESFVEGVKLIEGQLDEVLRRAGLEPVDHEGSFDPEIHDAMLSEPRDDVPDKSILQVFERGYRFNGKLLRPAKVRVASNPDMPAAPRADESAAGGDEVASGAADAGSGDDA
ncbi:MAG: nucleotide exchange factor GrpE [Acidobacteriota bacterium]